MPGAVAVEPKQHNKGLFPTLNQTLASLRKYLKKREKIGLTVNKIKPSELPKKMVLPRRNTVGINISKYVLKR